MKSSKVYTMKRVVVKCHRNACFLKEKNETMVNPASEKPKFGRGARSFGIKQNFGIGLIPIDRCLSPSNRLQNMAYKDYDI